jgi:hypothetical protein
LSAWSFLAKGGSSAHDHTICINSRFYRRSGVCGSAGTVLLGGPADARRITGGGGRIGAVVSRARR